jgi:hypothetical protein
MAWKYPRLRAALIRHDETAPARERAWELACDELDERLAARRDAEALDAVQRALDEDPASDELRVSPFAMSIDVLRRLAGEEVTG